MSPRPHTMEPLGHRDWLLGRLSPRGDLDAPAPAPGRDGFAAVRVPRAWPAGCAGPSESSQCARCCQCTSTTRGTERDAGLMVTVPPRPCVTCVPGAFSSPVQPETETGGSKSCSVQSWQSAGLGQRPANHFSHFPAPCPPPAPKARGRGRRIRQQGTWSAQGAVSAPHSGQAQGRGWAGPADKARGPLP